jgi:hypothetical protein
VPWLSTRQPHVTGTGGEALIGEFAAPEFPGRDRQVNSSRRSDHQLLHYNFPREIAEFSKFEFLALEASAEWMLEEVEGGFRFTRVFACDQSLPLAIFRTAG